VNINFLCQFNNTGVGRHSENAFFGMARVRPKGVAVNYVDSSNQGAVERLVASCRTDRDVTLQFWRTSRQLLDRLRGQRVVWQHFETDKLPPRWIDELDAFDRVWMPSEWARTVALAHGLAPAKVQTVPAGVNERIFYPRPVPHEGFRFLSVGKYEARKSIDESIAAFREEFPRATFPQLQFWLKADFPMFPDRVVKLRERLADDDRFRVISGELSDFEMAQLYNQADAFVFASKAEGFGLPCIEAMACGVPVLATCYSGQTIFLEPAAGLFIPVDYAIGPIVDADFSYFYTVEFGGTDFGNWAIPTVAAIRKAMRAAFDESASWKDKARQASEIVRSRFSWDEIGRRAIAQLAA